MPLPEQRPPKFKPDIGSIFKHFEKQSDNLGRIFADTTDIEEIVDQFIENNQAIGKMIETMRLSAAGRTFTLTPLVAEFSQEAEDINVHQSYRLLHNVERSINHMFVQPIDAFEGVYYHYTLYIPISEDMKSDTPEKLLKEHWELVYQNTPDEFKELIYQFEPRYMVNRVYGWDGSWLAYSVIIKDTGAFWSTPLTEAPFRGIDPFLIVPKGEFAILENDGTGSSVTKIGYVIDHLKERAVGNRTIRFQKGKTIEVAPEWIAAHMASTLASTLETKKEIAIGAGPARNFGERVASATIDKLPTSEEVLEFMKKDVMGYPTYEFNPEMIRRTRKSILKDVSPTISSRIKKILYRS